MKGGQNCKIYFEGRAASFAGGLEEVGKKEESRMTPRFWA